MPESPEKRQVNIRMDPSVHRLAEAAKEALGKPSVADIYSIALIEYVQNNPELVEGMHNVLTTEAEVATSALQKLTSLRDQDS